MAESADMISRLPRSPDLKTAVQNELARFKKKLTKARTSLQQVIDDDEATILIDGWDVFATLQPTKNSTMASPLSNSETI